MNITDLSNEFNRQAADAPSVAGLQGELSRRSVVRTRNHARRSLVAVAAAVILVAGGATALATVLPGHSTPTATSPQDLVHAFAVQQRASDKLPPGNLKYAGDDLDPNSTRLVGDSEHGKEWAAVDGHGRICLIIQLPNKVGGGSCVTPQSFEQHGVGGSTSGSADYGAPYQGAAAYLLPSDVPESSVKKAVQQIRSETQDLSGWVEYYYRHSTPLIAMSNNIDVEVGTITITRPGGTAVTVHTS